MPIDFKKLLDPVHQEQASREREAREAEQEAKDRKVREAVTLLHQQAHYDGLTDMERQFVRSCRMSVSLFRPLTDKQERWLFDLAAPHMRSDTA